MIIVNARFLTQKITGVQRFAVEISLILYKLRPDLFVFVTPGNIIHPGLANKLNAKIIGVNKGAIWEQIDLRLFLFLKQNPILLNFCNSGLLYYKFQIVTIHDMSYKINSDWFSRLFYLWYNFLIPNLVNKSLKVFTVSNSSKNDIISILKTAPDKINVVYNSSYINTNNNFEAIVNGKYILTVSSLEPRKNLNNLIRAFNRIEGKTKLVIVGLQNSNFRSGLDLALLGENIEVKGYQTDKELGCLMNGAEVFVSVSLYEGFGLPAVEAMGFGCPVIVSDIPAHREICADAAIYADPNNVDDIKNKIISVLENWELKNKLKLAGKKNIERFDWHKSAENVLKCLDEII